MDIKLLNRKTFEGRQIHELPVVLPSECSAQVKKLEGLEDRERSNVGNVVGY